MKNDYCWRMSHLEIADKLTEVYHTVDISKNDTKKFYNTNFDMVLEYIGKDYKSKKEANSIGHKSLYSYAYDAIVDISNIGRWKKSKWKYIISKSQIKALRKAYHTILHNHRAKDDRYFVRIPFNTIDILNTVYSLLSTLNEHDKNIVRDFLKNDIISNALAENHLKLFRKEYNGKPQLHTIPKATNLYNKIDDMNQVANKPL